MSALAAALVIGGLLVIGGMALMGGIVRLADKPRPTPPVPLRVVRLEPDVLPVPELAAEVSGVVPLTVVEEDGSVRRWTDGGVA
jgi:hypothetical protein